MKNFATAIKSTDALSSKEMKNVKGGGNCGFQFIDDSGRIGRTICGLDESQQPDYEDLSGTWCCNNCGDIGC